MEPIISKEETQQKIDTFFAQANPIIWYSDLNNDRARRNKRQGNGPRMLSSPITLIKGAHQFHVRNEAAIRAAHALEDLHLEDMEATCFEDIHQAVLHAVGDIAGIGPITIYDIALRVAWLKAKDLDWPGKRAIMPRRYVYLHQGAYFGARELFGSKMLRKNLDIVKHNNRVCYRISVEKLHEIFLHSPAGGFEQFWDDGDNRIPSWLIENILCISFNTKHKKKKEKQVEAPVSYSCL